MKQLFRNSTHIRGESHDCLVVEINGKKVKITYQAFNAQEWCNVEFFDGVKWNNIFNMMDMGIKPESNAYNIWDEDKRKQRADTLFDIGKIRSEQLLS